MQQVPIFLSNHRILYPNGLVNTVWKDENFSLTEKIFREINSIVTYAFRKTIAFTKVLSNSCYKIFAIIPRNQIEEHSVGIL